MNPAGVDAAPEGRPRGGLFYVNGPPLTALVIRLAGQDCDDLGQSAGRCGDAREARHVRLARHEARLARHEQRHAPPAEQAHVEHARVALPVQHLEALAAPGLRRVRPARREVRVVVRRAFRLLEDAEEPRRVGRGGPGVVFSGAARAFERRRSCGRAH